ncbi:MAG: hypothetical protein U5K27_02055 [Desulfotignum sp.]|nr:hypothetical protein [Desulfotignum sp.]
MKIHRVSLGPLILAAAVLLTACCDCGYCSIRAVTITDTRGRQMTFSSPPKRVVSLVPGITDIICALGADPALVGVTYHGARPRQKNHLPIVGRIRVSGCEQNCSPGSGCGVCVAVSKTCEGPSGNPWL